MSTESQREPDSVTVELEHALPGATSAKERLDVLVRLSKRLTSFDNSRSVELATEAIDLAKRLDDQNSLALAWRNLCEAYFYWGKQQELLAATYSCEATLRESGNRAALASVLSNRAFVLGVAGSTDESIMLLEEAEGLMTEPPPLDDLEREVLAGICIGFGQIAANSDDLDVMIANGERAVETARPIAGYRGLPGMLITLAGYYLRNGDLERSREITIEADQAARTANLPLHLFSWNKIARDFIEAVTTGDPDAAASVVDGYVAAVDRFRTGAVDRLQVLGGSVVSFPMVTKHLGIFSADLERLADLAALSIQIAVEGEVPSYLPVLYQSAADIAQARGRHKEEAEHLRRAVRVERELGLRQAATRSDLARMTKEVEAQFAISQLEHQRNEDLTRLNADLEYERDRIDSLLYNTLPGPIVDLLKAGATTIAEHIREASVMFVDVVESTPLFTELEPAIAVEWLNDLFSRLDHLVESHGVEKIRTIGDGYMVAAGVPTRRSDHAEVLCRLGLEMVKEVERLPLRNQHRTQIRIGINSGPVVAGIIGRRKYQYDLWGDTVNLASRMESLGEPGRIHLTPATYRLVRSAFPCETRGVIEVKGRGELETWFVRDPAVLDGDPKHRHG